ncbi:GHKL domain-containing protein [Bacillus sp. FJAT-28004]|uniref:GHKL domain-containing protein n=1 Tax=Bacillus sp. FJAT-28004 TaxID=1679165 RepID=UPI0006B54176|nr:GHKL domain-containing protein [Bacillus sp. FJAT-28004]
MKPDIVYTKKRMIYFIVLSIAILSVLIGIKLFSTYHYTTKSAEMTLAKQYTEIATEIADGLDKSVYKQFLLTKTDDEHRKNVKQYLDEYRKRVNALYIYILLLDESDVSKVMVTAFSPSTIDVPIGFPCTVPTDQVNMAKNGVNYFTGVLHDKLSESYMSVGVPFFDEDGTVLGVVGIDIAAKDLGYVSKYVVKNNMFIFGVDVLFALVLLAGVYVLNKWYKARLRQDMQESEKMYISELGKIVDTIKSSRHDLMNHLQVLNGLMDIRRYDKAHDYLKQLTEESKTLNLSLNIKNPILMVLFQSKRERAHSKNIQINFETDYDPFDKIESMDLVKLLSNLLDNAIEAVEPHSVYLTQEIQVQCKVENEKYIFTIENPAVLTNEEQRNFFQYGYTTKAEGSDLRGNGLAIVRRTVEKYKGELQFQYEEGKVLIRIRI